MQVDGERLTLRVRHDPVIAVVGKSIRRIHPVERLIRAAVSMNRDATICFHHDETNRFWKVSRKSAGVVNGASSNKNSHEMKLDVGSAPRAFNVGTHALLDEVAALL